MPPGAGATQPPSFVRGPEGVQTGWDAEQPDQVTVWHVGDSGLSHGVPAANAAEIKARTDDVAISLSMFIVLPLSVKRLTSDPRQF